MLPHAVYFETLASIADENTPEWHATVAGLVVLRLVDDWLDFGPHIVATDVSGLDAVRTAIAQVPAGNPIKTLLGQAVDAMVASDKASIRTVAPALLAYAETLHYNAQFALDRDVLLTLQKYANAENDADTILRTSFRLGIVYRHFGDLALAEKYHLAAEQQAILLGDIESALHARVSLAKTTAARGNLPLADTICAQVTKDAEAAKIWRMVGYGLHERAHVAHLRKDYQGMIRFAYNAIEHMPTANDRDRVMADLAAAFLRIGHVAAARDTSLILSSTAEQQQIRWQSTINLMSSAALEWQESSFELYRAALQCVDLPPRDAIFYHRTAAEGFRIFGDRVRANEELREAQAIAERHQMQQFVFEIEEELTQQPMGEWSPDIDTIADAIGERLQFHTLNMM